MSVPDVSRMYVTIGVLAVEIFKLPAMERVTRVSIEYSGSGDSGDIDQVTFFRTIGTEQGVVQDDDIVKIEASCSDELRSRIISFVQTNALNYFGGCAIDTAKVITTFFASALWEKLERDYGGWENNDGASGELAMVFDETAGTVKIVGEHRSYFVDYETYETELVLTDTDGQAEGVGEAVGSIPRQ